MVYQWLKIEQLFPATCLLCGDSGQGQRDLCSGCYQDLPRNNCACRRCALPIPAGDLCGQCQRSPPTFDQALVPLLYQAPVDFLVQELKFHGRLAVARLFSDLLGEALEYWPEAFRAECIIPIPLHPRRLRERGFNQALELARPLAKRFQIPLLSEGVRRTRSTPAQSTLDLPTRQANVRGAFALSHSLSFRRVAIIDDVITTGSTLNELAQVLRQAGAQEIQVWACARTPRI